MRPSEEAADERYECFNCGTRVEGLDGRECPDCGGRLRNIGRPRDL